MKTIFKVLLVMCIFTIFAQNAKALDTLNPCWRMYYPHDPDHNSFNPDSVMLDTCATTNPIEPVLYAYKWYLVILPPGALNVPEAPRDTLIYRDWRDIDTNFIELREGFLNIENKFSPFIMRKEHPEGVDTSSLGSRSWLIKFEEYFNIDSVVFYLSSIQNLTFAGYDMRAARFDDVYQNTVRNGAEIIDIKQNQPSEKITVKILKNIDYNKTLELYDIKFRLIFNYHLSDFEANNTIDLNISDFSAGVYFLRCGNYIRSFIICR
ncbi:MAG: hypothetical protein HZB41_08500 [Ignavibacteriae bacterium]|nr:hypothetical protein [Ignavibacteriota bacterium]